MICDKMMDLPDIHAWGSLLGLLAPSEFFVTVDHSVFWQRHVAWSKPKGEDLRHYVTQRYASNQVFLSLMLGAELGVLFNSSSETAEMRSCLSTDRYGDIKYWIGLILLLDACVTVIAIVTNFTLWGMIAAISDTNTHCLLRSSIGQYITCLPPRFIVASLYLFLLWLTLWFIELLNGPMRIIVILGVISLFFQVVIPLSAFGRLIIHTGAMAKKRVIDKELEKDLLPSGLHASLLIRATDRQRKYTSAVHQYRKKARSPMASASPSAASALKTPNAEPSQRNFPRESRPEASPGHTRSNSDTLDEDAESQILATVRMLGGSNHDNPNNGFSNNRPPPSPTNTRGHRRDMSHDSAEFNFPRASILNSASSFALQEVVESALSSVRDFDLEDEQSFMMGSAYITPTDNLNATRRNRPSIISFPQNNERVSSLASPPSEHRSARRSFMGLARRRRSSGTRRVVAEWEEEEAVRHDYDVAPPAEIIEEEEEDHDEEIEELLAPMATPRRRPRASMLNQSRGLSSLRNLVTQNTMDPHDTSDEESDDEVQFHADDRAMHMSSQSSTNQNTGGPSSIHRYNSSRPPLPDAQAGTANHESAHLLGNSPKGYYSKRP